MINNGSWPEQRRYLKNEQSVTVIRVTKTSNLSCNIAAKLVEQRWSAFYIPHTTCPHNKNNVLQVAAACYRK